jgi:hypothetical protein
VKPLTLYALTDGEFEALRTKLETVPRDQWPANIDYDACELSVRLRAMERAEQDLEG